MKNNVILKILILTAIAGFSISFRSQTGFINLNIELNKILRRVKSFLPVNMLTKAIEQYMDDARELSYELEGCLVNLRATLYFEEKTDFSAHQRICLNSYFNYFAHFEILRSMLYKFLSDTCPDELIDTCHEISSGFNDVVGRIEEKVKDFMNMLLLTDQKFESLSPIISKVKLETISNVVMNSILVINQESFYNQLQQVLDSKEEQVALEELTGDKPVLSSTKRNIKKLDLAYSVDNKLRDDPFQNPDRYLLSTGTKPRLTDLHLVFKNDDNTSELLKL
jgi:hypothetical protein